MRSLLFLLFALVASLSGYSQLKDYNIGPKGDTLNAIDKQDRKQGKWVNHVDEVRGEPGYEEEGIYKDNHKEGTWRIYSLQGDLIGLETYKWGLKCGVCAYYGINGTLLREETWVALDPGKLYDTLVIEDINHPDHYKTVIIKNTGASLKDGTWKYYDPMSGMVARTETWDLGDLKKSQVGQRAPDSTQAVAKPKEVLDFEKKASKHKVKVQDGSVH
ncbi:MAG TPA: hypothetical protein VG101_12305 [Puia sp.]|jgi:hypothetical protein|nr:hypothetical protein [Puia sp.]